MPSHVPDPRPQLNIQGEPVTITNFRSTLPQPPETGERLALVRAGRAAALRLDEDGLHAAARALTDPAAVARTIRSGLLTDEGVGPANLTVALGHVYLTELLPLLQPRAGAVARTVDPPTIRGYLDEDGVPQAMIELNFKDEAHLVEQLAQTVRQTRRMGRHYEDSILTKRVSRPIMVHAARIVFEDGSEPFVVLIVRDGLTRVVSSWAAQYPQLDVDELAAKMAEALLATKRGRKADDPETAIRARGRGLVQQDMRVRFAQGTTGEHPNEDAIRIGQTLTLPAQTILSTGTVGAPGMAPQEQFNDAVQALVASIHGEFQPWEKSAETAAAIERALPRAVHDEDLDEPVAQLATGSLPVTHVGKVFKALGHFLGENDVPKAALWRAVYLVAYLCEPRAFGAIKRHLRNLLGLSRIENQTYAAHLMTLIDLPWRHAKQDTRRQALRAWQSGGPIPYEIFGVDWNPVPTADFTTLVPKALAGDTDAQYTLQVAGGIALVADKLLMSNVGSAEASEQVPFRSNINSVVTGLGSHEAGLWLLAHAANAFQADRRAVNSYTEQELRRTAPAPGSYTVPRPDPDNPAQPKRDNADQAEPLTSYWVVYHSDPARAETEKAKKAKKDATAKPIVETNAAKVIRLRSQIRSSLNAALGDLQGALALGNSDPTLQPILGDRATWQDLVDTVGKLNGVLYSSPPPAPSLVVDDEDDEDQDEDGLR